MLILNKVRYKNFTSIGNEFIEVNLIENKLTAIIGKNGSGKTTAAVAIFFALYGKSMRNTTLANLVNSITNKNLLVELELTTGGKDYLIRRGYKPKIFEIYENGELKDQSKDYQDYLEKNVIKITPKTFTQVVMLGAANFIPFMELDAKSRRDLIEDLLDLNIFSLMNGILKEKITANKSDVININNKINNAEMKLSTAKSADKEIQKVYTDVILDRNNKITSLNSELEKNQIDLDTLQTELNNISYDNVLLVKYEKGISQLTAEISNKNRELNSIKSENDFYIHTDSCSKCKQTIDINYKNQILKDNNELITKIKFDVSILENRIETGQLKYNEMKLIKDSYDIKKYEVSKKESDIEYIKRSIKNIKFEISEYENKGKNKTTFDFKSLEADIENAKLDRDDILSFKKVLDNSSELLKDGGIKALIIKKYIPILNELINSYLDKLDFFVKFELDENFNESIKSRYRDDFTIDSFSEGEKARINLAILFAFRDIARVRNTANINLLFLDEVFSGALDYSAIENLMNILTNDKNGANIFVVTHDESFQDKFKNIIMFEKKNNFTVRVENEN